MKNTLVIDVERMNQMDGYRIPFQIVLMLDIVLLEMGLTYFVVKNRYGTNQQRSFPKDRLDDFLKFPNRDENFNLI